MAREAVGPPDWEKLPWETTPYPGVFLFKLDEEPDPANPDVPLFSVFALKVDPGSLIPPHIHKREPGWLETLTFSESGDCKILRIGSSERILTPSTLTIKPYEPFGLENYGLQHYHFTSRMVPGFTGYQEIEEVREVK